MEKSVVGKVVEVEGREGLFVIVNHKNYEDVGSCSYARDYAIVPYQAELDDMKVNLADAQVLEIRSVKMPVKVREDKKAYTQYGTSLIRGVDTRYLERVWEEIVIPSR
jgi:hypothetical protein